MIILGVAGSSELLREQVAAALVRGRLAMDWRFDTQDMRQVRERLINRLPTNLVVFSDVAEEWQARLVRRGGGLVIHVAGEGVAESSVAVDRTDVVFPVGCVGSVRAVVNAEFWDWEERCVLFQPEMLKGLG